jgi:hypothetical protein
MGFFDRITDSVVAWGQGVVTRVASPLREERERLIAAREAMYTGTQYEGRGLAVPWDKAPQGAKRVPLRLQRPSVQYDLPKLSVRRVTSMLFGEGRTPALGFELVDEGPEIEGEGDDDIEKELAEWLEDLAERSQLWRKCLVWSRLGCAAGSACMVWSVVDGDVEFRPLRSQHCTPVFDPRRPGRLLELELRYKFPKAIRETQRDGSVIERCVDYWHRETWDAEKHTVFVDVAVDERGREPSWTVGEEVAHGLGRVPGVWVRPFDDADEGALDGESLFDGVEDLVEDIDRTLSQKSRALRYNLDPTRVWFGLTEQDEARVRTADGPAVSVSSKNDGADVTQLELAGTSLGVAEEHANTQRARALETLRVVSPDPDKLLAAATSRVALELLYAPMLELVGELRATFGAALKDLLSQIVDAVRSGPLAKPGALTLRPPVALPAGNVRLGWGAHFAATIQEQSAAASTASLLVSDRLIDRETAVKWVCRTLGIADASAVLRVLEDEDQQALAASGGAVVADTALNGAQIATARELLVSAANGELPIDSIAALLGEAFPSFDAQKIAAMLNPIRSARRLAPAQTTPPTPPPPPSGGETNPNPAAEPPSPASSARESDVEDA